MPRGKEKRGATVVVTRLDGSRVSGELAAVRPDALLLLSDGRDESIGFADIETIRIKKRSRAGLFGLLGVAAGVVFTGAAALGSGGFADADITVVEAAGISGAVAGYRYLRTGIPPAVVTLDLYFQEAAGPPFDVTFRRLTEISIPARTTDWSGLYLGLRLNWRI